MVAIHIEKTLGEKQANFFGFLFFVPKRSATSEREKENKCHFIAKKEKCSNKRR